MRRIGIRDLPNVQYLSALNARRGRYSADFGCGYKRVAPVVTTNKHKLDAVISPKGA